MKTKRGTQVQTKRSARVSKTTFSPVTDVVAAHSILGAPSIQELLDNVGFTPEAVISAAAEQPRLFLMVAEYRARKMRARSQAKMQLERTRAERALELREAARVSGDRMTEGNLAEMLALDAGVRDGEEALAAADEEDEFARLLIDAYRMRSNALRVISDLAGAELAVEKIHASQTAQLTSARRKLREKYGEE